MKKIMKQSAVKKRTPRIIKPAPIKLPYNRVQIYDLHQFLLFDISCDRCANKEQKCTHCEIDKVITESGIFAIKVQIQSTDKSKYFVYTDDRESWDVTRSALEKIKKQYYR